MNRIFHCGNNSNCRENPYSKSQCDCFCKTCGEDDTCRNCGVVVPTGVYVYCLDCVAPDRNKTNVPAQPPMQRCRDDGARATATATFKVGQVVELARDLAGGQLKAGTRGIVVTRRKGQNYPNFVLVQLAGSPEETNIQPEHLRVVVPTAWEQWFAFSAAHPAERPPSTGVRFSLVPVSALNATVRVLEFGAAKHSPDGWRLLPDDFGVRDYNAVMRHLLAWRQGEKLDPESGENHLAHAICRLLFQLTRESK